MKGRQKETNKNKAQARIERAAHQYVLYIMCVYKQILLF